VLFQNEKKIRSLAKKGELVGDDERKSVIKTLTEEISRLERNLTNADAALNKINYQVKTTSELTCSSCGVTLVAKTNCGHHQKAAKYPKCFTCAKQQESARIQVDKTRLKIAGFTKLQKNLQLENVYGKNIRRC